MEERILIGEKLTKKGVLVYYLFLSFWGFIGVLGCSNVFRYLNLTFLNEVIILIVIFMACLLFLTPIIGSTEVMEFTNQYVSYYHVKGFLNQFKEVIRVLRNGKEVPNICMKTTNIVKMNLSYVPFLMAWAQKGYKLKITFLLDDGTVFSFFPTTIGQMEKGDYEAAFCLLEKNDIEIVDKYNLRKVLNKNSTVFYQYIQSIEEEKKND